MPAACRCITSCASAFAFCSSVNCFLSTWPCTRRCCISSSSFAVTFACALADSSALTCSARSISRASSNLDSSSICTCVDLICLSRPSACSFAAFSACFFAAHSFLKPSIIRYRSCNCFCIASDVFVRVCISACIYARACSLSACCCS